MTNAEKYNSADECVVAWNKFCRVQNNSCVNCPLFDKSTKSSIICFSRWMYLEAEEEILPCPFCGGEAILHNSLESWVECTVCHNSTEMHACSSGAIEKWNRRVSK